MILGRKTLRDMKRGFSQFAVVFLMVFLTVFIFCGIGGEWIGLRENAEKYYAETNLADVWVHSASGVGGEGLNNVLALPEVLGAERRAMAEAAAALDGKPKIDLYILERNDISKPYVKEGAAFGAGAGGIWLDARFAAARGLAVNGSLTLEYGGAELTQSIRGLVYSPEYVYTESDALTPDFRNQGYAFIPSALVSGNPDFVWTQLLIKVKAGATDFAALEEKVGRALDGKYSVFIARDKHASYQMFQAEVEQHRAMGVIFPPVFALVALLTILTTMARLIANQRGQIGTLKAVGFSDKRILLHYLSFGFFLPLAASVLGACLGPLLLPPLFYPSMSAFYTLPVWKPAFDISFVVMPAFTVAACVLAAFFACRGILRMKPAEALRPKAPKAVKGGGGGMRAMRKLGFYFQWNARDMRRNKTRSAMAAVGALGCAALLVCAFGMNADMNDLKVWQYGQIYKFETKIVLPENAPAAQADGIAAEANGEKIMERAIEVRSGKGKYGGTLLVTDGGSLIAFTDKDRRETALPRDGVSISYKLAGQLGVKTGDTVSWHIFMEEGWKECRIAGIYRSPTTQGLTMGKEVLEAFGYGFEPTAVLSAERYEGGAAGEKAVYREDLYAGWDDLTESFMLMVWILIFAAVLLAVTVLYNLGVLSFTEMTRELATLKVLGFGAGKLRRLLLMQNLFLTAAGFVLGVPCGLLVIRAMTASMGDSFDMIAKLHWTDVVYSGLITVGIAALVTLLFGGKLRKLDTVSALKSAE
ncbi:MAG: FtsX-like permease family protein [Clostridiales bacterium]|jgi:putative ABC transport system permease protein|nr:FtsX-like permease family protein [Clostridiales bacterium]